MKQRPYIEPTIRTIAGGFLLICAYFAYYYPEFKAFWLGFLIFIAINLFQSGMTRFCLMEKLLKRAGFRSEMDEIRSLALHDALTDLPNRSFLEDHIELALSQAQRHKQQVALLFIDLDNFKQINDIQGHKVGDQLLVSVSKALKGKLRPYDTLARWGGDKFVVLLPDLRESSQARTVGDKLVSTVNEELTKYQNLHTTLSIGIAIYPDDADNTESLLIQADKALARWHDDEHDWISPAVFIPLAENMGLIEDVGLQVLEKSLTHYSRSAWKGHIRMAINISNRQLFSRAFLPSIIDLINAHDIVPENLKLEITESSALGTDSAIHTIQTLADAGFYISLDDFGTGFSSLSRLHELPFNELKIDMSFVRRIKTREGHAMLKIITDMGKAMNLAIVAEGVEDKETADALRDMGVDYLQGYYFSRPKPPGECEQFFAGNTAY